MRRRIGVELTVSLLATNVLPPRSTFVGPINYIVVAILINLVMVRSDTLHGYGT